MLEISLITVIYKRICKFWDITQSDLNSYKWRYFHQKSSRGTFAFEHLYLQISDSHIPYEVFNEFMSFLVLLIHAFTP
jgi:hypothetical protein